MRSGWITMVGVLVALQMPAQSLSGINSINKDLAREDKMVWHNMSPKGNKVYGTRTNEAISELLSKHSPKRKTVVAIIDSGVDIEHEDLSSSVWTNPNEIPGNGKDDDHNGYVDDVHGWNFLIDDEGEDITYENMEAVRVLRLSKALEQREQPYPDWLTKETLTNAARIYNENVQEMNALKQFSLTWDFMDSTAQSLIGETYTMEDMKGVEANDNEDITQAKQLFTVFRTFGIEKSDLTEMSRQYHKMEDYYLNFDFHPRMSFDPSQGTYGNNHYAGTHAEHGTHVAGIVAASRNNDLGAQGVAGEHAEIMVLRAVPDGDEYDVDIANAIRYAADNGAHIINMSFGKGLSPGRDQVNEALTYAASKGLLIVHAAGNDAANNDEVLNFPSAEGLPDDTRESYLTVGALSPSKKGKKMIAQFSNYGRTTVELFAPGADIYATLPDDVYGFRSGTSMAAPVVSGVAALIWAYFPELTAQELRALLIQHGLDLGKKKVRVPGTKEKVRFQAISTQGKVVNTYNIIEALDGQN